MTTRREKAKAAEPKANRTATTGSSELKSQQRNGSWKENLGKYLIDISKYVVTGVLITSIFKDVDDKFFIYVWSIVVAVIALIAGLVLTNKKEH